MKGISYQNNLNRIVGVLFFITAFSIPISLAFNSICIAILFLFSFFFFDQKNFISNIKAKKVYGFYFLFFLIQVVSILYALNTKPAIDTVKQNVVFFILPIAFINLEKQINGKIYKASFWGLLSAILITTLVSLANLSYKSITTQITTSSFFRESFIEEGLYNIHVPYFSLLMIFSLIWVLKTPLIRNKLIKYLVSLVLFFSLFFLSGVMSLSILALFILTNFLTSNISNSKKTGIMIALIFVSFFSVNYIKNSKKIAHVTGSEHILYRAQKILMSKDTVRLLNWKSVTKVISTHPFVGVGADGGLELLQKERPISSEPYINKHNAHNEFLEILLRYGLIGLLIYLILLFKLFNKALKRKQVVFIWFLLVFVISGLTESYLQRQIGLTFFTFYSLIFYNYKPLEKK